MLNRCSKYNSRTLSGASLPQTASQNSFYYNSAICDFFFFFFRLCVFVCFYVGAFLVFVLGTLCLLCFYFCHYLSMCVVFFFQESLFHPFLHFSCAGRKMQKRNKPQTTIRRQSRTRDRNGTRVFGSTNVLSGNMLKNRKRYIFLSSVKTRQIFFV